MTTCKLDLANDQTLQTEGSTMNRPYSQPLSMRFQDSGVSTSCVFYESIAVDECKPMFTVGQIVTDASVQESGFQLLFQWNSVWGGHYAIVRSITESGPIIARCIGLHARDYMVKSVYTA